MDVGRGVGSDGGPQIFFIYIRYLKEIYGGEGGIRTHGTVARTSVFETDPFDRSGTSPALGEARLPSIDRAPIIGPALGRNLHR
jgi:hypothetical protein